MQIKYATDTEGARVPWHLELDGSATRGLIIGGVGSGKSEALRTLAAHAKAEGVRIWTCSPREEDLGGKNMTRKEWDEAIRSHTGQAPVLALLDSEGPHDLESIPRNPRVSVVVAGTPRRGEARPQPGKLDVPRLKSEDMRLDLGTSRACGGRGRGLMRVADSTGETSREVAVDYLPRVPIARR